MGLRPVRTTYGIALRLHEGLCDLRTCPSGEYQPGRSRARKMPVRVQGLRLCVESFLWIICWWLVPYAGLAADLDPGQVRECQD